MQKNKPFDIFTLQWHITNSCQLRCKHCYVDFSKPLLLDIWNFQTALDNYERFLEYFWIQWKLYLTGWDPFLHPDFWNIVSLTMEKGIEVSLFWNYHQLHNRNIQKLIDNNIKFYQLSLEWLKETHDDIRWLGTFEGVLDAIEKLESKWIYTLVNMTLSKMNQDQLLPLVEFLAYHTNLSRFDFVRVVPLWKSSVEIMVEKLKFRSILLKLLELETKLKNDWRKLVIWKKDHLWKLLYYEFDKLKIDLDDKVHGCWMVYRHLTVVENGDIYLCRKLPIKLGNIVKDNLIKIYEQNEIIQKVLDDTFVEGCNGCKLKKVCKWCPAVTYWSKWNLQEKDPQCWKQNITP